MSSDRQEIGAYALLSALLYDSRCPIVVSRDALMLVETLRMQQVDFGHAVTELEDGSGLVLTPTGPLDLLDDYRAMTCGDAVAGMDVQDHPQEGSAQADDAVSMPIDPELIEEIEDAEHEAELNYMSMLMEAERSGESAPVKVGPYTAMIMIGAFQLAARHPSMSGIPVQVLRSMVNLFKPWFEGTPGERIILRGEHPEWDK